MDDKTKDLLTKLEKFADAYPCVCHQLYPGARAYHGQDCHTELAQEFVAQFVAHLEENNQDS